MQPKMQFHLNINQLFPLECVCVCVCAFVCVVATRFVEPPPPPPQNRTQFKSQNGTFIPNHIKSLNGKTQENGKNPLEEWLVPAHLLPAHLPHVWEAWRRGVHLLHRCTASA